VTERVPPASAKLHLVTQDTRDTANVDSLPWRSRAAAPETAGRISCAVSLSSPSTGHRLNDVIGLRHCPRRHFDQWTTGCCTRSSPSWWWQLWSCDRCGAVELHVLAASGLHRIARDRPARRTLRYRRHGPRAPLASASGRTSRIHAPCAITHPRRRVPQDREEHRPPRRRGPQDVERPAAKYPGLSSVDCGMMPERSK
jgi:hypothetical protein